MVGNNRKNLSILKEKKKKKNLSIPEKRMFLESLIMCYIYKITVYKEII